jgi:hypothetical protein
MKEYLSSKPIWHESSEKILALDGKSILIVRSDNDITPGQLRVETAPPNSLEPRKVSVIVWGVVVPDEPWEPVTMNPTAPQKFYEMGQWSQFLSQDALDLIRPQSDPSLSYAELLLALPVAAKVT